MKRPLLTSLLAMRLGALAAALLAVGCGPTTGGQTGDLGGAHDGELASTPTVDTAVRCETVDTVITDLSADTDLGFSANDVLAFADEEFEVSVSWGDPDDTSSGVIIAPETDVSDLTLTISYTDGDVRFSKLAEGPDGGSEPTTTGAVPTTAVGSTEPAVDPAEPMPTTALVEESDQTSPSTGVTAAPPPDNAAVGNVCQDHVEFDVRVSLVSSGGALEETFDAVLVATSANSATFMVSIDPAELNGTLTLTPANGEVLELMLSAEVTPDGVSGTLTAGVENRTGSGEEAVASYMQVVIASWPAE